MNQLLCDALPASLRRELLSWQEIRPLAPDGSDRRFFRLRRGTVSCLCLYHPHPPGRGVTENDSYYHIGRHLWQRGLPVPEIFHYCPEEGWFLLEDLGETSLQAAYGQEETDRGRLDLYRRAVQLLVDLQSRGTPGFDPAWCFDTPYYDAELVLNRECLYFQEAFLQGYLGWQTVPPALAADFAWLIHQALTGPEQVVLHRDFQSRNLLVQPQRLGLIDFQGARLGPPQYDLAALLLDPYVNLPLSLQEELLADYLSRWRSLNGGDPAAWRHRYDYLALCRNLQILGAYGFLSRQKGKPFFRQFIPAACRSLVVRLSLFPAPEFPILRRLAQQAWDQVAG
jgi:aminoglycoside/choline kinase family phosphotransferase